MPPIEVLLEILPAAAVSGAVLFAAWPWRGKPWPLPLALAAGYATSQALARGVPDPLPADATELLFHFGIAAALVGVVETDVRLPAAGRGGLRFLVAGVVVWLLLRGVAEHTWASTGATVAWMGGLTAGLFALWSALAWRARELEGFVLPSIWLVVAGGGALALTQARSALLGQMSGALAAALGPALLLGLLHRRLTLRGAVPVLVVLTAALWMSGHFLAELPAWGAILLSVAPLAALGGRRWWIGVLLAAVLAAAAVYLAHDAHAPADDDPYACYY